MVIFFVGVIEFKCIFDSIDCFMIFFIIKEDVILKFIVRYFRYDFLLWIIYVIGWINCVNGDDLFVGCI